MQIDTQITVSRFVNEMNHLTDQLVFTASGDGISKSANWMVRDSIYEMAKIYVVRCLTDYTSYLFMNMEANNGKWRNAVAHIRETFDWDGFFEKVWADQISGVDITDEYIVTLPISKHLVIL